MSKQYICALVLLFIGLNMLYNPVLGQNNFVVYMAIVVLFISALLFITEAIKEIKKKK